MCIQHDPFDLLDGRSPLAENTTLGHGPSAGRGRPIVAISERLAGPADAMIAERDDWIPLGAIPLDISPLRCLEGLSGSGRGAVAWPGYRCGRCGVVGWNRAGGQRPAGSRSTGWRCRPGPIRRRVARPARLAAAPLRVRCVVHRQMRSLIPLEMSVSGQFIGSARAGIATFAMYEMPMSFYFGE